MPVSTVIANEHNTDKFIKPEKLGRNPKVMQPESPRILLILEICDGYVILLLEETYPFLPR